MTNDIENLLSEIRDPERLSPAPSRRRVAIARGIAGLTVLVSGGALAFGAVASLADPPPGEDSSVLAPAVVPTHTATPTSIPPTVDGVSPHFDVNTDINTIPIPADFPPDEVENAKIWLTQQSITAQCMEEKGFHYTYTTWWLRDPSAPLGPAEGEGPGTPFWIALDGEPDRPLGEDYDWRTAGCTGYAVHVTGMDGAH